MKDITELRKEIDGIDDKILPLYLKRMEVSGEIGRLKMESSRATTDKNREKEIVYRLAKDVPEDMKLYVKELYDAVFLTSKAYQNRFIKRTSGTVENLKKLLSAPLPEFPVSATVACQGIYGANSGAAAEKLFPISDITYFKNFEGVFSAVEKGLCEFGVLPIENSTAGSVLDVYDLMKKYRFSIVKSVRLRVEHCLAAVNGADMKDIKTVISHPQALSQCAEYIKNKGVTAEAAENTAVAARKVAEAGDKSVAALCTLKSAEAYGLTVLERNVQDSSANYTRFICISKDLRVYKGADKISVMTGLEHKPGSLNRILSSFYALGLNLTKIESRPTAGFEFTFYFDFDGDVADQGVLNLIADLENGSDKFVFLGSYKETV